MIRSRDQVVAALETILEKSADADLEALAASLQTWKDKNSRVRVAPFLQEIFETVEDEFSFRKAMEDECSSSEFNHRIAGDR